MEAIDARIYPYKEEIKTGAKIVGIPLALVAIPALVTAYSYSPIRIWRGGIIDVLLFEVISLGLQAINPFSVKALLLIGGLSGAGAIGAVALYRHCDRL